MSNQADATRATVRQAEEPDIPAILSLVLTSYRQFPLFNYLYSPLEYDKDAAHDTVFFWHRRVLLDLLNPTVMILVAEVPTTLSPTNASPGDGADPVELESWRMLEWVLRNRKLSQASNKMPGSVVAGFAIWKDRLGGRAGPSEKAAVQKTNWINSLRGEFLRRLLCLVRSAYARLLTSKIWSWSSSHASESRELLLVNGLPAKRSTSYALSRVY